MKHGYQILKMALLLLVFQLYNTGLLTRRLEFLGYKLVNTHI